MTDKQLSQAKVYFVSLIAITIGSILIWQYFHGGVPNHHLLHRADLPAISNWWGGILLPILSWFLLGRIQTRLLKNASENINNSTKKVTFSFVISFIYGAALSLAFVQGYQDVSSIMFPGILFFAIFFRIYREEFLLGFIISMSFTFGAVLPTIFGSLIALISVIVYFSVRFIWQHVKSVFQVKEVR